MLRALLDRAETTGGFSGDNNWEPLVVIDAITGGFGITWNTPIGDPLVIGLGAKASNVGGEAINLAVLAKLLRIQTGGPADHALGDVEFEGTFPVPDFLASGSLEGGVTATQNPVEVSVGLKATTTPSPAEDSRTLSYQTPEGSRPKSSGGMPPGSPCMCSRRSWLSVPRRRGVLSAGARAPVPDARR